MTHTRLFFSTLILILVFSTATHALSFGEATYYVPIVTSDSVEVDLTGSLGKQGIALLTEGAPTFIVTIAEADTSSLAVRYRIFDHNGDMIMVDDVPEDEVADRFEVTLSQLEPGWYRFVFYVQDELVCTRDFVVLRGREDTTPVMAESSFGNSFGMDNERLQAHEAEIMRQVGANWIFGVTTPTWEETQFQPGGSFVWRAKQEERELALEAGLIPYGPIDSAPAWATEDNKRVHYLIDYFQFVQAYREAVPNVHYVGTRLPDSDHGPSDYTQVKVTPAALHDQQGRHIGHAIHIQDNDAERLDELVANGIQLRGDALLVQLPELTAPPEQIDWDRLKQLQLRWNRHHGSAALWTMLPNTPIDQRQDNSLATSGSTPLVLSLFGTNTRDETEDDTSNVGPFDSPLQAQWLVRAHLLQLSVGVDRIFTGSLSTGPSGARLYSGGAGAFPDIPQRPRPALAAYATLTEQLSGATYIGQLIMPRDIWALVFSYQGEPIVAVWTTRDQAILELNNVNTNEVEIVGALGSVRTQPIENNRLTLVLDPYPQYVRGLDAGVIAQGLTSEYIERVASLFTMTNTHRDSDRAERTTEALQTMATELWLYALTGDDVTQTIEAWSQAVSEMFSLATELYEAVIDGQADAQAVLYELYGMLPVLAEVGAAIGTPLGNGDVEAHIAGTDALLREARSAGERWIYPDGSVPHHALRLLKMPLDWWQHHRTAPQSAASAWAIIAREAAALAVVGSQQHGMGQTHTLFIASRAERTLRPYPGFRPSEVVAHAESILASISPWIAPDVFRPTFLETEKQRSADGVKSDVDWMGWDELSWSLEVVNGAGEDVTGYLELDAPEGWLWRLGNRLLHASVPRHDVPVELSGTPNQGQLTTLDLNLLVPHDADLGEYSVVVGLYSRYGLADRIVMTIQVAAEEPQLLAAPSSEPDALSVVAEPEHL